MVQVASSIEDYLLDASRQRALADDLAHYRGTGPGGALGMEGWLRSAGSSQGATGAVIHHLGIDVAQAAEDAEPGPQAGTGDSRAHPPMPMLTCSASFNLSHDLGLSSLAALAGLATNDLAPVAHTLPLVGLGLAGSSDPGRGLTHQLLVVAEHGDPGGFGAFDLDPRGRSHPDRVRVAK